LDGDILVGEQMVTLAPGAAMAVAFTWQPAAVGDRPLTAEVAPSDDDEPTDNMRTTTVPVREPIHDVAVVSVTAAPNPATPGARVEVTVRLANQGDYAETAAVVLEVDPPSGPTLGPQDVQLQAGAAADATLVWESATEGVHVLEATVTPLQGETDTADNDGQGAVTVSSQVLVTFKVAAAADDATSGCTFRPIANELELGFDQSCKPEVAYTAGFRFGGVSIPQGAAVTSAHMELRSASQYTYRVSTGVWAEASADAEPFTAAHAPADLDRTTAWAAWDVTAPWAYLEWVSTPELAGVVQEVVDLDGWSSGNALSLIVATLDGGGARTRHRRVFAQERTDSDGAARLVVTYSP
jgi:hypothetical protein